MKANPAIIIAEEILTLLAAYQPLPILNGVLAPRADADLFLESFTQHDQIPLVPAAR